jgi:hypothetical protein
VFVAGLSGVQVVLRSVTSLENVETPLGKMIAITILLTPLLLLLLLLTQSL